MNTAILWDSSAVLAAMDGRDVEHQRAQATVQALVQERRPGFITNYIQAEAHALVLQHLGRIVALKWLLQAGLPIVRVLPEEEDRAREILAQFTDKNWSFCDAISFAVMETRGVYQAFSFDRHFLQFSKWRVRGLDT